MVNGSWLSFVHPAVDVTDEAGGLGQMGGKWGQELFALGKWVAYGRGTGQWHLLKLVYKRTWNINMPRQARKESGTGMMGNHFHLLIRERDEKVGEIWRNEYFRFSAVERRGEERPAEGIERTGCISLTVRTVDWCWARTYSETVMSLTCPSGTQPSKSNCRILENLNYP